MCVICAGVGEKYKCAVQHKAEHRECLDYVLVMGEIHVCSEAHGRAHLNLSVVDWEIQVQHMAEHNCTCP